MTSRQWVNIDDDGAAYSLLRRLARRVPVETIDTLWLFPTRRASGLESTVAVLSVFDSADPGRRRVGAARWLVTRDRRGTASVEQEMHEYATAPAEALQRVVDGVVRRLGDDTREPPRTVELAGDRPTWDELLRELGAPPEAESTETTETSGEPEADSTVALATPGETPDPADTGTPDAQPAGAAARKSDEVPAGTVDPGTAAV